MCSSLAVQFVYFFCGLKNLLLSSFLKMSILFYSHCPCFSDVHKKTKQNTLLNINLYILQRKFWNFNSKSKNLKIRKIYWPPFLIWNIICDMGARGGVVVKALSYKPAGRGFDFRWCHWNFSLTYSFRSHYGPRIDSVSNRNDYQVYFLG